MKISPEGERYADTLFFNKSRAIYQEAQKALLEHKFVSHEDTAQKDYALQLEAAAKMAEARMHSYVDAYEYEAEEVKHEDVVEFIEAARSIIDRQSGLISTGAGGTITMVRNQWSPEYRERMLTYFKEKAFLLLEPAMNELILRSKETSIKRASKKKMNKRTELFRWIFEESQGRQHNLIDLRNFLSSHQEWTESEVEAGSDYLEGENFIEQKDDSGLLVVLTHDGVKAGSSSDEIDALRPSQPVIQHTQNINTFNAPVGAVQQGNQNVANVAQRFGENMTEVVDLIAQLRQQIAPDHQESGIEFIDALEDELQKDAPKESRVRLFLKSAGELATEAGKVVVGELAKRLLSGEISF